MFSNPFTKVSIRKANLKFGEERILANLPETFLGNFAFSNRSHFAQPACILVAYERVRIKREMKRSRGAIWSTDEFGLSNFRVCEPANFDND